MAAQMELTRTSTAPAERVWQLMAEPSCWPAWAPHMWHVRGVSGAATTIHMGQELRIVGPVADVGIDLEITAVDAPYSWTMRTTVPVLGTVTSTHNLVVTEGVVAEGEDGPRTAVVLHMAATAPYWVASPALRAYRPLATLAIQRLLDLASREADGQRISRLRMCLPAL